MLDKKKGIAALISATLVFGAIGAAAPAVSDSSLFGTEIAYAKSTKKLVQTKQQKTTATQVVPVTGKKVRKYINGKWTWVTEVKMTKKKITLKRTACKYKNEYTGKTWWEYGAWHR